MSSRSYPERPLVGVGVLVFHDGKVLLVKRKNEPDRGLWAIPGGLIKLGEKVTDAAVREVFEETGIRVKIKRLIDVVDKMVLDDHGRVKYHFVIIDFEGEPLSYSPSASSDVEEARWFSAGEVKGIKLSDKTRELLIKLGFIS